MKMAIKNKFNRTDLIKKLGKYPTGNICNAHSKLKAMDSRIAALSPGMKLAGPAKTVAIISGENAAIHRAVHNARPGDVPHSVASIEKAKQLLNYRPEVTTIDGLKETVKWFYEYINMKSNV